MKYHTSTWRACFAAALCFLCAATQVRAQFGPGGFGGFQGGGGSSRRGGSSNTRTYNNNSTVGDAVFSIDPETRSLIVIADEETGRYISQVVSNLDTPK